MAPEKREWTVPGPVRALLWWPAIAFVVVMVAPHAAAVGIAASGAALMIVGAVLPLVARSLRRTPVASRIDDHPTVEMPTIEIPRTGRAA